MNKQTLSQSNERLTENFIAYEFAVSDDYPVLAKSMVVSDYEIKMLRLLCETILQPLRNQFPDDSITVISGKRSDELNTAIKGAINSDHLYCMSADISTDNLKEKFDWLYKNTSYRQIILYPEQGFIHVSVNSMSKPYKKEALIKYRDSNDYIPYSSPNAVNSAISGISEKIKMVGVGIKSKVVKTKEPKEETESNKVIKFIKKTWKYLFRKEIVSNAVFFLEMFKTIYGGPKGKNAEDHEDVIARISYVQDHLDRVQKFMPNAETASVAKSINEDTDKRRFGDFNAEIIKNKHGVGKNGINLGFQGKIKGEDIRLGYDPMDGSAEFKVGPFKLHF